MQWLKENGLAFLVAAYTLRASIYLRLAYSDLVHLRLSLERGLIMTYVRFRHPELYARLRDRSPLP